MTILDDITVEPTAVQLANLAANFRAWISTNVPQIDPNDPVVNAVIVGPWIDRLARQINRVESLATLTALSSSNLASVLSLVDEDSLSVFLVELHGLTVNSAAFAVGEIRLTFNTATPGRYLIPINSIFSANGVDFRTTDLYTLTADGADNTIQLRQASALEYYAVIPVVALTEGSSGNIAGGTTLTTTMNFASPLSIVAEDAFTGGTSGATISDVVAAIKNRYASNVLYTREQIVNYIAKLSDFGGVSQVGVVGIGDAEMQRSVHPFLPVQQSGMADIYVAGSVYPRKKSIVVSGTVQSTVGNSSLVTLAIDVDDAPGYLKILSATDVTTNQPASVVTEVRGVGTKSQLGVLQPNVQDNPKFTSFSAFQTATVTVSIPSVVGAGTLRNIELIVLTQPGISAAQTAISSRLNRSLGGDVLIRSAVPIFVSMTVTLEAQYELQVPDVDLMRQAIVDEISNRPMRASLVTSEITRALLPYLASDIYVRTVRFDGEVVATDGSTFSIYGTDLLSCPNIPAEQLTSRTCAFYTNASLIQFELSRVLAPSTP